MWRTQNEICDEELKAHNSLIPSTNWETNKIMKKPNYHTQFPSNIILVNIGLIQFVVPTEFENNHIIVVLSLVVISHKYHVVEMLVK